MGANVVDQTVEVGLVDARRRGCARHGEGRERASQRRRCSRLTVIGELLRIGTVGQERGGQRTEHGDVGAGPHREMFVGEGGTLAASRVEHPHSPAPALVLAQAADRIREGGSVAVRYDGVGADEQKESGTRRIPDGVQHRVTGDEFGGDQDGSVVDGDRRVERPTPDRRKPLRGRNLARTVVREPGGQVQRDGIGSARGDRGLQARAKIVEDREPVGVHAAESWSVEAGRTVMPLGEPAPFATRIPTGDGMFSVPAYPDHPPCLDRDDDPARRGTDPAERQLLSFHP